MQESTARKKMRKCYGWIIILIINSSNCWKVWYQFECTSIITVQHLPLFWCRYFFPLLTFSTKEFLEIHMTHTCSHTHIYHLLRENHWTLIHSWDVFCLFLKLMLTIMFWTIHHWISLHVHLPIPRGLFPLPITSSML